MFLSMKLGGKFEKKKGVPFYNPFAFKFHVEKRREKREKKSLSKH